MRLFGKDHERPPADPENIKAVLQQLLAFLDGVELPRRRPQTVDVLGFRDVVAYFTDEHPADPAISSGAMVCTPHPKGRLVFQVFLDDENKVCSGPSGAPYGRRLIARRFDDELTSYLSGRDLLIFR